MKGKHIINLFFLCLLFQSCSNTRFLPEGELLYTGANVTIEKNDSTKKSRKELKNNLKALVRPKPNKSILGLKPKLYIYNLAGTPKKEKGLRYWLKNKVGEPPVLYSQVDLEYNKSVLQNYIENNGYFNGKSKADSTRVDKKASATYTVTSGKQYAINEVKFPIDSSKIGIEIRNTQRRSRLKKGDPYSLEVIKEERIRIDSRLKEKGFFYFNPDNIIVQVDSTVAKNKVDLIVKIKSDASKLATTPYKINKIVVFSNYTLDAENKALKIDTIKKQNGLAIIDPENLFKPRIFDRALYFKKEDLYNRTNHNLSLNRLVNLGVFKFVKNQFKVADTTGNYLNAYYYLTPLPRKSIQLELLGKTNSANYTGTELNLNWSNRNTFKAAELLTITAFGGVEIQVSGQNNGFNVYRAGTEANLIWPRIIAPFTFKSASGFIPKTKASLGYEFQNRTNLYSLQTFKGSFGYLWKENERKEHQLNISEITYVSPRDVTDLYLEKIVANPTLNKVIEKQLIFGPTYSYTYTNTTQKRRKNTFYYKGTVDLAGNITGLATGANAANEAPKTLFSVPFSQFFKIENDFRHYYKFSEDAQLATRFIAGAGIAYGNSREMPFIKQFFIGGTNSLRAFRARSIGPGSFNDVIENINSFLPDQSGDIKLEFNTEYRAKIYGLVKGALFIDAGNIWLLRENTEKPGAKFSNKFMSEIAVGAGAGLRFDLSFLILRTDLAFPLRKPNLPLENRWVLDQINFGSGAWRKENLIFNLAIGYPF